MAHTGRVLVVEDEPLMAEVVERYLRRDGYDVHVVHDGRQVLRVFDEQQPDLVVLDLMLPGCDGFSLSRDLRRRSNVPIIMLTALGEEADRLQGFESGADDYVTKPFSAPELVARVGAVLRRVRAVEPDLLQFDGLTIDVPARTVSTDAGPVELTAREFDLLLFFARHPRQALTREQIVEALWPWDESPDPATLTVHIRRMRTKLERDPARPRLLRTVWGVGYRFDP